MRNYSKQFLLFLVLVLFCTGKVYCGAHSARQGFSDDFSEGLSPDRWFLLRKHWGKGNNGVVPELVKIEQDTVNGVTKNVVVLYGHGDQYTGDIKGLKKVKSPTNPYVPCDEVTRVGACLITKDYFASGTYDVVMKIQNTPSPSGMCTSIWAFHYEEHFGAHEDTTGLELNPNDPQYQPRFKEGNSDDGFYSTINSEIDTPELGHQGDYTVGWYNTYVSEVDAGALYSKFDMPNILDGEYHKYTFKWETELVETDLTDSDFLPSSNYNYFYVAKADSPYQGEPAVKKEDGKWYVHLGKCVSFFVDDQQVGVNAKQVSPVSARILIGVWFPDWSEGAAWSESTLKVSSVSFKPANSDGDVYYQPESFPNDGLYSTEGVVLSN
jgi:hypothetical protein